MMHSRTATLPNFLIIGAAKAGTTSLHSYLALHPQIHMSKHKELAFFDDRLRWSKGIDWYKSQFDSSYPVNGEASPQYTLHPTVVGVPERIKNVLGSPKLIYIVRDPIDRLLSEYTQIWDRWPNARGFDLDILHSTTPYHCSCYFTQLTHYLRLFPEENILMLVLERLNSKPVETLQQVFRFLGVDDKYTSPDFTRRLNTGEEKRFVAPWFEKVAPQFLQDELRECKWMPWRINRVFHHLARIGGKEIKKPKITKDQERKVQEMLSGEVRGLRDFMGDPLAEWRAYA
jgi:hypothetical protein